MLLSPLDGVREWGKFILLVLAAHLKHVMCVFTVILDISRNFQGGVLSDQKKKTKKKNTTSPLSWIEAKNNKEKKMYLIIFTA